MNLTLILGVIIMALGVFGWEYSYRYLRNARERIRKQPLAALFVAFSIPMWVIRVRKYSPFVVGLGLGMILLGLS